MNSSLDLIIGPMFSGKTSELIRQLVTYSKAGFNVLYINSSFDSRSDVGFSTHNSSLSTTQSDIKMVKVSKLMSDVRLVQNSDVIGVDEAQFFDDLVDFYRFAVETLKKKVVVCGLNGTSQRSRFGQITELVPVCDNITFLHSFCTRCAEGKTIVPAPFSKRISTVQSTVCVGGIESYIPVCRAHFDEE